MSECEHKSGWITTVNSKILLFEDTLIDEPEVEVRCNEIGCGVTTRFKIDNGIPKEIIE